jgi:hypothetical protein
MDSLLTFKSNTFRSDISTFITETKPRVQKIENPQNNSPVCSVQPTLPCLIDKGLGVFANNQEAVIILSFGLAITIFCWGLGKDISEVVAKLKQ